MSEPLPFLDPRLGLRELLLANFVDLAPVNIGRFPGTSLGDKLPYVAIEIQGGAQNYFTDEPVMDIDYFAATNAATSLLAAEVSAFLLGYPHTVLVGTRRFTIDSVGIPRRPVQEPWDDENIGRESATYQFTIRR